MRCGQFRRHTLSVSPRHLTTAFDTSCLAGIFCAGVNGCHRNKRCISMVSVMNIHESTNRATCTNRHTIIRGQFSQVVEKVSRMTFMNRQHSLTTRFVSMVSIMNIHGRQIVRLVNTLDDFYQAVVLDNHRNNIREKSLSEFSRIMAAKTLKNPYITGRQ